MQGWERASHGTGMGHTTNKGFWIPEKPLAPPAEALLALPEPAKPRAFKSHTRAPAAPKPRKRLTTRQPKEVKQEADEEVEEEPPEVIDCLLPMGLDLKLKIHIQGRHKVW